MIENILLYLKKNLTTLVEAPIVFITVLILGFIISFYVVKWHYDKQLEIKDERLKNKDDLIEEYRERLHLIPASGNVYSKLNHEELKKEALDLVSKIRQTLAQTIKKRDSFRYTRERKVAKSDEERKQIQDERNKREHQIFLESMAIYENRFKIDAILIRDELISRLPRNAKYKFELPLLFEHPTNELGITRVSDYLEMLAKNLK